ncbi:MAG: T9SS type A sorting domain-containing protein [Muribaculaceae bacterium]|nr:T9SS type A sorting domain-containing protein [Muribaculaceae bacterium]
MKRFTILLMALMATCLLNINAGCFVVGDVVGGGWNTNVGVELNPVDGSSTLYRGEVTITGWFCIATQLTTTANQWNEFNGNYRYSPTATGGTTMPIGVAQAMEKARDASWKIAASGTYIVEVDFAALTVKCYTETEGSGIFLRGDITGWNALPTYEFVKNSDTEYVLENVKLQGFFKVAKFDWAKLTLGGAKDNYRATVGETYNLATTDNVNMCLDATYQCAKITLILGDAPSLLIEGTKTTSGIFIRGVINEWETLPEWEFTDEGEGHYTLRNMTPTGEFKIGDDSWGVYNYGKGDADVVLNADNEIYYNGQGMTLADNAECKLITFIPLESKASIYFDTTSSAEAATAETFKVTADNGTIIVTGAAPSEVTIYDLNGALVSKNSTKAKVGTGVYIVKINDKATKIAVK